LPSFFPLALRLRRVIRLAARIHARGCTRDGETRRGKGGQREEDQEALREHGLLGEREREKRVIERSV